MSADSFFVGCVFLIGIVAVKISFLKIMKTARKSSGLRLQSLRPHMLAIADKIDAVDFGIKIRKLEKMLCCNNFSHFDAWIFLIFIIGQNRCIHLNFCSGNELEDFKKDFDPSNIGILQYTPLAHAHKTIHRSQKC